MIDLSKTIEPKSDQMNADDLIAGSKTIKITSVKVCAGEQPASICYEGGDGKPYKPCKSMLRVLVKAWGKNGEDYIGRTLTLYNDPEVKWAGGEVGGIRISHMSDISERFTMMLTQSRGRRAPFAVEPIFTEPLNELSEGRYEDLVFEIEGAKTMPELALVGEKIKAARYDAAGNKKIKAVYAKAVSAIRADLAIP